MNTPNQNTHNDTPTSICYIGIGSNLNDPIGQVKTAIKHLQSLQETQLIAQSSLYQSTAIGPGQQADYINAVVKLETALPADALLAALQKIEHSQGRTRTVRWGARTLDLDILLFGNAVINSEHLTIPHPQMCVRNFVLIPLHEIAANLCLPSNQSLQSLCEQCGTLGLKKIETNCGTTL